MIGRPKIASRNLWLLGWFLIWSLASTLLADTAHAQNALSLTVLPGGTAAEVQIELQMDFSDTTVGGAVVLAYDSDALVVDGIEFNSELGNDPDFQCPGSAGIVCPADVDFVSFGSILGLSGQATIATLSVHLVGSNAATLGLGTGSPFAGVGGSELAVSLTGVEVEPGVPVPPRAHARVSAEACRSTLAVLSARIASCLTAGNSP